MNRRDFMASAAAATLTLPAVVWAAEPKPVFQQRGYYLCFMRLPTFGLAVWKEILDDAAADGANTVILWMGGAFRSKRFPVTWQWAKDHQNVQADFGRELIAHAHRRGIDVLLGFTPFGYDGVNQVRLERPELKAVGQDGKPVAEFGIGCWGWNLCPAKAESQRFMREYIREMAFEFYPEADGLFIESSDYAISTGKDGRSDETNSRLLAAARAGGLGLVAGDGLLDHSGRPPSHGGWLRAHEPLL